MELFACGILEELELVVPGFQPVFCLGKELLERLETLMLPCAFRLDFDKPLFQFGQPSGVRGSGGPVFPVGLLQGLELLEFR